MSSKPSSVSLYRSNLAPEYGNALLIVDPQLDFHPDEDGKRGYAGSLGVPGANEDAKRIEAFIDANMGKIDELYVTLDTHMAYHIAHPLYWVNKDGKHPEPFTTITQKDVVNKVWTTVKPTARGWALNYVTQLAKSQRFQLTIWPEHCKIGTRGHTVQESILAAVNRWERENGKPAKYIIKGNNSDTEHYSALRAEVEVKADANTKLNKSLLAELKKHKKVFVCGQALSHCVNYTVRDMVDNWGGRKTAEIVILDDASSSVQGFEDEGKKFLGDMRDKHVSVKTTIEAASMM